jgi:hypothetical protein
LVTMYDVSSGAGISSKSTPKRAGSRVPLYDEACSFPRQRRPPICSNQQPGGNFVDLACLINNDARASLSLHRVDMASHVPILIPQQRISQYTASRTVSDKPDPNARIVGRGRHRLSIQCHPGKDALPGICSLMAVNVRKWRRGGHKSPELWFRPLSTGASVRRAHDP